MPIPILSPLDFNQNEARNIRAHILAADPGSPVSGQFWYNSTTNRLKVFDTAARILATQSDSLDKFAVPVANLSMGNFLLQNLGTPAAASDAATKGYVDNVALGLDVKTSVRAATVIAGTLASSFANGQVIDGITLATGDRILIKNQAAGAENGIYVVAASGAPTRSTDCNTASNYVSGAFVFTEQGTANAGSAWVVATQGSITPGTTSVSWVQFAGGTTYSAGSGLTLTGTVFSANVSGSTIEISGNNLRVKSSATNGQPLLSGGTGAEGAYGALNLAGGATLVTGTLPVGNGGTGGATAAGARTALGVPGKFVQSIGDGAATSIVVTHNLGTQDVTVQVYTNASPFQEVNVEIQNTSVNTITVIFATAPASNAYRVVVLG